MKEKLSLSLKRTHFKFFEITILVVLPILLLFVALSIKQSAGPYWIGRNSDPEYPYLLNSLNLIEFKSPGLIQHPGTTLEEMGAGVIFVVHIYRGGFKNLINDVLTNPEFFLNVQSGLIISLIVLSVFLVGAFTLFLTGSLFFCSYHTIYPLFIGNFLGSIKPSFT